MQDRNYDNLVEKGWKGMEVMLDQELPQRRKYRPIWFLLLFGIASCCGVAAYLTIASDGKEIEAVHQPLADSKLADSGVEIQVSDSGSQALSSSEEERQQNEDGGNVENTGEVGSTIDPFVSKQVSAIGKEDPELQETFNQKVSSEIIGTERQTASPANRNELASKDRVTSKISGNDEVLAQTGKGLLGLERNPSASDLALSSDDEELMSSKTDLTEANESGEHAINDEAQVLEELRSEVSNYQALETSRVSILEIEKRIFSVGSIVKLKRPRPIEVIFEAGLNSSGHNNLVGYYAGMGISKPISRRWSLRSSLRYQLIAKASYYNDQFFSKDLLASDLENVDSPTEEDEPVGSFSNISQDQQIIEGQFDLAHQSIESIRMLSIPLSAEFRLSRKHQLALGIQYSNLLALSNDRLSLRDASGAFTPGELSSEESLQRLGLVTRHNFGFNLSHRYVILKKLGINTEINLGANGILKTEVPQGLRNSLSYLSLGLDYRF